MKIIKLNKGFSTIVDDEDFEYLNQFKWYINKKGYARRNKKINNKWIHFSMHRVIINPPKNKQIDHINGNKLDNRKTNLRICTNTQNQGNIQKRKNNQSGFKGVVYRKEIKKYRAYMSQNGKQINLGHYLTKEDAAKAYNKAAQEYFREYARLNSL